MVHTVDVIIEFGVVLQGVSDVDAIVVCIEDSIVVLIVVTSIT